MSIDPGKNTVVYSQDGKTWKWRTKTLWEYASSLNPEDISTKELLPQLEHDRWFQKYSKPTVLNLSLIHILRCRPAI